MKEIFDAITPETCRRYPGSKWQTHPESVLPLWVADMDFPIASEIQQAIIERVNTGFVGYPMHGGGPELHLALQKRLQERFQWHIEPADVLIVPSLGRALHTCIAAASRPGEGVITQTPVYHRFLIGIRETGRTTLENPMVFSEQGWELDFDHLETLVTPDTRVLMLCNPQNPTGRVWARPELDRLAAFVLKHNLFVVSDELHADVNYGSHHTVFASLSPELEQRTFTLYGPGKTFNLAGLGLGFVISRNPALLQKYREVLLGTLPEPNVLSSAAVLAAYTQAEHWESEVLAYLQANRDHLMARLSAELPDVRWAPLEATYTLLLNLRAYPFAREAQKVLLGEGLAFNDGASFGKDFWGYVRINFATSRQILDQAVNRLVHILQKHQATAAIQ
ncbi:MalY/PatB family protein [Deinococcus cellulosilyticus]|uniref:cysteine-S-conjugate beta-lyase n=1 Tax=Deinococcus cellulosilyticus (strain DSM 18568 / NBRC 106333 / KACC 11606 / 5516J-15) TaxID=1223518 RepID=A0A511N4U6_DEIC1|nr:PatB family C-S lyase [Deinococcus cellulosilyticus]GEM47884.1 aminotransferase class I [Deinococcus cellulosilyticus NBRC 106333 = KACC 11606]